MKTIFLFMISFIIKSETIDVFTYNTQRPPNIIISENEIGGIYVDLFREVLDRIGLKYNLVKIPNARRRALFIEGKSLYDCCSNPAWRNKEEEQAVQLYTRPIYETKDVFVFPYGHTFPIKDLQVLKDKNVAVVRGYGYRGDKFFGKRIDLESEIEVLKFLGHNRAHVGIINEDVVLYWASKNPNKIEVQGIHDQATLHIRVHRNVASRLSDINKAIDSMIKSGTREKILNKYLK